MANRTKTEQQQIDFLAGQVAALGVALFAVLKHHPHRDAAAAEVADAIEHQLSAMLPSALPDEVQRGIEFVRDKYLLKPPPDPGQPSARR